MFRNKKVEEGLDESVRMTDSLQESVGAGQHPASEHGNRRRAHRPVPVENATAKSLGQEDDTATPLPDAAQPSTSRQADATAAKSTEADTSTSNTGTNATAQETEASSESHQADSGRHKNVLGGVLGGDFLSRGWVRKQRGLLLLFVLFAIAMVSNRYYVEHLTKEKLATEESIKFLREQRIQMKRDYQDNVRISHIATQLDSLGIGIIAGPPYELNSPDKKKK